MRGSGPHCAHTASPQRLKTRAVANWITMQVPTGPLCTSSKLGADISENYLLAKLGVLLPPSPALLPPLPLLVFSFFLSLLFLANWFFTKLGEQAEALNKKNRVIDYPKNCPDEKRTDSM